MPDICGLRGPVGHGPTYNRVSRFFRKWRTEKRIETTTMAKQSLVREFIAFIKHEKKWWMIPLIAVLLGVALLIVLGSSSPLAPFIYPLF